MVKPAMSEMPTGKEITGPEYHTGQRNKFSVTGEAYQPRNRNKGALEVVFVSIEPLIY